MHWSGSVLQRRSEAPAHNLLERSLHPSLFPCRSLSASRSSVIQPFFFFILSPFPRQLFLGALCPSCLHCPLHSTTPIFVHYKLHVTCGVYAKCSFVSILNKSLENFNTFLSTDLSAICSMTANDQESLVMKSSFYSKHSETT